MRSGRAGDVSLHDPRQGDSDRQAEPELSLDRMSIDVHAGAVHREDEIGHHRSDHQRGAVEGSRGSELQRQDRSLVGQEGEGHRSGSSASLGRSPPDRTSDEDPDRRREDGAERRGASGHDQDRRQHCSDARED